MANFKQTMLQTPIIHYADGGCSIVKRKPPIVSGVQKSFSDEYKKIPPSGIMEVRSGNCTTKTEGGSQMHDNNSLAHTSWNCKYHVVFAPKYRRKIFYGEHKAEIGKILRELCKWKEVNIIEAEVCPDHIHMLIEIPPKLSVASFMGFLKGKSSIIIHQRHGNLKYKYGNRSFWCRGYYVDTAGKNAKRIEEYIKNQLKEDMIHDQMTLRGWEDPFTGSK